MPLHKIFDLFQITKLITRVNKNSRMIKLRVKTTIHARLQGYSTSYNTTTSEEREFHANDQIIAIKTVKLSSHNEEKRMMERGIMSPNHEP